MASSHSLLFATNRQSLCVQTTASHIGSVLTSLGCNLPLTPCRHKAPYQRTRSYSDHHLNYLDNGNTLLS
ncbi:Uncharacterised protein [Vibrio cholerae]|nr:Uncharacterised protein [Vibrio cholerae]